MNATATAAKPPTESVMATTPPACSFPPVDLEQAVMLGQGNVNVMLLLDTLVMANSASLEIVKLETVLWCMILHQM